MIATTGVYITGINSVSGNVIAGNLKVYQLHVIPEQVENFNYLISRLRSILQLSEKRVEKIKKNSSKDKDKNPFNE